MVNLVLAQGKTETPREILDSVPAVEVFVVAGYEGDVGCLGCRWHSSAPAMCHRAASAHFSPLMYLYQQAACLMGGKATELLLESDFVRDANTEHCEEMLVLLGRGR